MTQTSTASAVVASDYENPGQGGRSPNPIQNTYKKVVIVAACDVTRRA